MKPGQSLTLWWQDYVAGRLRTPQAIVAAARAENPLPPTRHGELPPHGPAFDTPRRLRAPAFFNSQPHLLQSMQADWAHCDSRLRLWANRYVEDVRKRDIPLFVHTAFRAPADDAPSPHHIGEAVDIVHGIFGRDMTDDEWWFLYTLGQLTLDKVNATLKAADKLHLTWGGNSPTLSDPAHWQIDGWHNRSRRLPAISSVHQTPRSYLARH